MELTGTNWQTIQLRGTGRQMTVTIARPERANSINATLLHELNAALTAAEQSPDCRLFVLEGAPGVFCTGMDFQEAAASTSASSAETVDIAAYMELLKRFTTTSRVVIAKLDGKVIAGGVGLAAAADIVIATERTMFSLSEALWGLLPCCVIPFLIRRVGFQKAYHMTLTTRTFTATEAQAMGLVDELTAQPDEALRKLSLRLNLLEDQTLLDLKSYFRKMWIITGEMEQTAVREIERLTLQPHVQRNIANFAASGTFPWERRGQPSPSS